MKAHRPPRTAIALSALFCVGNAFAQSTTATSQTPPSPPTNNGPNTNANANPSTSEPTPITTTPIIPVSDPNVVLAPPTLGLRSVLDSVEAHYPLLEAARRDQDAADGEYLAAEGGFDPTLRVRGAAFPAGYYRYGRIDAVVEAPTALWGTTIFGGYRFGLGNVPAYYGEQETNYGGELRAGLIVPIWRNGPIDRRRANMRRAEYGRTAAAQSVAQQRIDFVRAATQRYWEWVAAGRRAAIAQSLLELAITRDAAVQTRAERGEIPTIDRVDNQRAVLQRQGFVVQAQRALQQTAIELSLYYRDASGAPRLPVTAQLPGSLPEPTVMDPAQLRRDVADAVSRRPEVARLEALREQFRIERDFARNQQAPGIDLSVVVSQDLGPGNPMTANTRMPTVVEVGLSVDVPFLNRAATGRARVAEAGHARLEQQARMARDRVEAEVRDALSAVEAARQRIEVARREVDVAQQLEVAERRRFDEGISTLLFVNLREQATAEARVREVDALLDFQRAMAAYRAAVSAPSVDPAPATP